MSYNDKFLIKAKFEDFLNQYSKYYPKYIVPIIKEHFWKEQDKLTTLDALMQIYQECGLYDGKPSYYHYHLEKISELFNINSNIMEIGSGYFPSFANMIARSQLKSAQGTITIFDPNLIVTSSKYHNMKLHKEEFNFHMDVSNCDLLVGLLPCNATEEIIKAAIMNNKDFYISMCGCNHSNSSFYGMPIFGMYSNYQQEMVELANELMKEYNPNREVVTQYMPYEYNAPYPVIYSKHK